MADIKLFAISTDNGRFTKISFDSADQDFTAGGYQRVFHSLRGQASSTARFVSVGASDGGKIVNVTGLLGSTWDDTAHNVRLSLGV